MIRRPASLLVCGMLLVLLAAPLSAACTGKDLRSSLTASEVQDLSEGLANRPYATGNHWRATRGRDVLHLIGTIHLHDPRLSDPIRRLTPIIENAERVLLEMTAQERNAMQTALARDPKLLVLENASLPDLLPEEDWNRFSSAMQARGIPPFIAARFRPWYVSMLLAVPPCLAASLAEHSGLDARIETIATSAGISVQALEAFDTGFRAFEDIPLSQQIDMLRASMTDPTASEDLFATVVASYIEEAHAESWLLAQVLAPRFATLGPEAQAAFDNLSKSLLDARNRNWIPVILQALAETDGVVVAAFGAGHLSGDAGVLSLLQAEGFRLENLPF